MVGPFPTDRDNKDLLDTGDFQVSGWPIPDSLLKEGLYAPIYYRIPTRNSRLQKSIGKKYLYFYKEVLILF